MALPKFENSPASDRWMTQTFEREGCMSRKHLATQPIAFLLGITPMFLELS